jgi:excisionase family DNA binding protein
MMNTQQSLLCTPEEAAKLLALSPRTVYAHASTGRIACVRIGRSLRIPRKEVERIAEQGLRDD